MLLAEAVNLVVSEVFALERPPTGEHRGFQTRLGWVRRIADCAGVSQQIANDELDRIVQDGWLAAAEPFNAMVTGDRSKAARGPSAVLWGVDVDQIVGPGPRHRLHTNWLRRGREAAFTWMGEGPSPHPRTPNWLQLAPGLPTQF
jgi:hypothetical protein